MASFGRPVSARARVELDPSGQFLEDAAAVERPSESLLEVRHGDRVGALTTAQHSQPTRRHPVVGAVPPAAVLPLLVGPQFGGLVEATLEEGHQRHGVTAGAAGIDQLPGLGQLPGEGTGPGQLGLEGAAGFDRPDDPGGGELPAAPGHGGPGVPQRDQLEGGAPAGGEGRHQVLGPVGRLPGRFEPPEAVPQPPEGEDVQAAQGDGVAGEPVVAPTVGDLERLLDLGQPLLRPQPEHGGGGQPVDHISQRRSGRAPGQDGGGGLVMVEGPGDVHGGREGGQVAADTGVHVGHLGILAEPFVEPQRQFERLDAVLAGEAGRVLELAEAPEEPSPGLDGTAGLEEFEGRLPVRDGLVVGEGGQCGVAGGDAALDRSLHGGRPGPPVMQGQGAQVRRQVGGVECLDGLGRPPVQPLAARHAQLLVEGLAHHGLGEAVRRLPLGARHFDDQPGVEGFLHGRQQRVVVELAHPAEHGDVELGTEDRRPGQDLPGLAAAGWKIGG